jgi:hypothetical protein
LKSLLREPLAHFLALGALLFLFFEWKGGSGPGSTRITITPGQVEHLASAFEKTWGRPPTEPEVKGLIDEHVREEVATREAVAMGLDRDDAIIRRRLRQKMEFLTEDEVDQAPPTDAELQGWLEKHAAAFGGGTQVALRLVYVSTEKRGASARTEAEKLLARLRGSPEANTDGLGDASMLPREFPIGPLSEVSRVFGSEFAAKVEATEPGQWSGPIESPYGLHLVLVLERTAATPPALAEVRRRVERELLAERRRARLEALYERLLRKYTVAVEMPEELEKKEAAAPAPGGTGR